MNNYEKIKNMSIDEWIAIHLKADGYCLRDFFDKKHRTTNCVYGIDCVDCLRQWLQEEVSE